MVSTSDDDTAGPAGGGERLEGDAANEAFVDADDIVDVTKRLRRLHRRVRAADLGEDRRSRLNRRLLTVSDTAREDLERARNQLDDLAGAVRREIRAAERERQADGQ